MTTARRVMRAALTRLLLVATAAGGCGASATPARTDAPSPSQSVGPAVVPAPAPVTEHLQIILAKADFPSYVCRAARNPCRGLADSVAVGPATSNLGGTGAMRAELIVDDSDPGPDGTCNTVEEHATFTFPAGMLTTWSIHRDCNFAGPRIIAVFSITGGTGAFAGARGSGREDDLDGIRWIGTITIPGTADIPEAS